MSDHFNHDDGFGVASGSKSKSKRRTYKKEKKKKDTKLFDSFLKCVNPADYCNNPTFDDDAISSSEEGADDQNGEFNLYLDVTSIIPLRRSTPASTYRTVSPKFYNLIVAVFGTLSISRKSVVFPSEEAMHDTQDSSDPSRAVCVVTTKGSKGIFPRCHENYENRPLNLFRERNDLTGTIEIVVTKVVIVDGSETDQDTKMYLTYLSSAMNANLLADVKRHVISNYCGVNDSVRLWIDRDDGLGEGSSEPRSATSEPRSATSEAPLSKSLLVDDDSLRSLESSSTTFLNKSSTTYLSAEIFPVGTPLASSKGVRFCDRLKRGDYVDAFDGRRWWEAVIIGVLPSDAVRLHYFGWSSQYDDTVQRDSGRIAPLWSKRSNWRDEVCKHTEIEVRVESGGWVRAIVQSVAADSGGKPVDNIAKLTFSPGLLKPGRSEVFSVLCKERFAQVSRVDNKSLLWVNIFDENVAELFTHVPHQNSQQHQLRERPRSTTPPPTPFQHRMKHSNSLPLLTKLNIPPSGSGNYGRDIDIRGRPQKKGCVGLYNLGNSCYLNSMMQCLFASPVLPYYLKSDSYLQDVNVNNPLGTGGKMADAVALLFKQVLSQEFTQLSPKLLKLVLGSVNSNFSGYGQHDSQEFLAFVLDAIHEDCNRILNKPCVDALDCLGLSPNVACDQSWERHKLRNDSVITDNFVGLTSSTVVCSACQRKSATYEPFTTLQLIIPASTRADQSVELRDCIQAFHVDEAMEGEAKYECNSSACGGRKTNATKIVKIAKAPNVLILHLKRFER